MYLKGILFLGIGLLSSGLILVLAGSWQVAFLLILAIWSFCRLYYFVFYVIEHRNHFHNPLMRGDGLAIPQFRESTTGL